MSESASIAAELTVPLYQSGSVQSRVREAKQVFGQRRVQVEQARRLAVEGAIQAWKNLQSARAQIRAFQAQVSATDIALEGVRQEADVGARTVLDVLDAEQEFLDAQVNLVRAQRDEIVAQYQLLSSVGRLTAGTWVSSSNFTTRPSTIAASAASGSASDRARSTAAAQAWARSRDSSVIGIGAPARDT